MSYTATVDGVSVAIIAKSITITETANGRNSCSFDIDSASGYRPAIDKEFILQLSGTTIFGGYIQAPNEFGFLGNAGQTIVTRVTAVDYNSLPDRRFVSASIPAGTLKAALQALEPYLTPYGVSLDAAQVTGPSIVALSYNYRKLTDVLNELTGVSNGYVWEIGYDKKLRMFQPGSTAAPFNISDGDSNHVGDIGSEPTLGYYANRTIVLFSSTARSAYGFLATSANFSNGEGVSIGGKTYHFQTTLTDSDGNVQIGADANHSLDNLAAAITLGGGAGSLYAASTTAQHDVTAYRLRDGLMIVTAVTPGTGGNAIAVTETCANASWITEGAITITTLALGADSALTNAVQANNTTEQASAGLWEQVIEEPQVFNEAVAQALADQYNAMAAQRPKRVTYVTQNTDTTLKPGQTQTISSTVRNLSGTYIITDITTKFETGSVVYKTIVAVGGTILPARWQDDARRLFSGSGGNLTGGAISVSTGGGGVTGAGTLNYLPKWASSVSSVLEDSIASQSGTEIDIAGQLYVRDNVPIIGWYESDQGTDLKLWRIAISSGVMVLQTMNDANSSLVANIWTITRAGVMAFAFQTQFANGSAGTPAIAFSSDTDTGWRWASSGVVWFVSNGADAVQFNGSAIAAGSLTLSTTPLAASSGGTGHASWTAGDLLYASGSTAISGLAAVATGRVLTSTGVGSSPAWSTDPTMASVTSTSWVSRTTGWIIDGGGNAEFLTLYTGELQAKTFLVDHEQALAGGQIITPSVGVLSEDFTVPALGTGSGNFRVEYLPGAPTMPIFSSGDTVVIRKFSRVSGALFMDEAIGVVTSPDTSNASYQQWTFTRNSGASGGGMAASTVVSAKTAVLDYGVSGNGFYEVSAVGPTLTLSITSSGTTATATSASAHGFKTGDTVVISGAAQPDYNGSFTITVTSSTVFTYTMAHSTSTPATGSPIAAGAYGINTPYAQIVTWATAPTQANQTIRSRYGNVRGITGTLEYGFFAGDFANKHYVRFTDQNAEIAGITLRLYDGSTETIRLDPSVPSIALGSTLPSAYGTGTGIWMGKDSSTYKFRVGDPSGNSLKWDGTNLVLASSTVTINSSGITVTDDSGGSFSATHGYQFSSGISGSIYGVYGRASGSLRDLGIINTTTGTTASASSTVQCSSNAGSASIVALATGSAASPASTFQITMTATTVFVMAASGDGELRVQDSGATKKLTLQPQFVGTSTAHDLNLLANNSTRLKIYSGGGLGVNGAADQGSGTINLPAGGGIFLNATAYTNPQWVLKLAITGTMDREGPYAGPSWYRGLLPIEEHRAFVREHFDLPIMSQEYDRDLFRRGDLLLASLEEAYLYIYQLHDRISDLEAAQGRIG